MDYGWYDKNSTNLGNRQDLFGVSEVEKSLFLIDAQDCLRDIFFNCEGNLYIHFNFIIGREILIARISYTNTKIA